MFRVGFFFLLCFVSLFLGFFFSLTRKYSGLKIYADLTQWILYSEPYYDLDYTETYDRKTHLETAVLGKVCFSSFALLKVCRKPGLCESGSEMERAAVFGLDSNSLYKEIIFVCIC